MMIPSRDVKNMSRGKNYWLFCDTLMIAFWTLAGLTSRQPLKHGERKVVTQSHRGAQRRGLFSVRFGLGDEAFKGDHCGDAFTEKAVNGEVR